MYVVYVCVCMVYVWYMYVCVYGACVYCIGMVYVWVFIQVDSVCKYIVHMWVYGMPVWASV